MTVGSKNKQKTTLIKAVCGTKNAPALPPWWCMEYTHPPLLVTDNNTLHGLLYYCCTCKCFIIGAPFHLYSLCLAHHLKQKKPTNFRSFSYFCSFIKTVLRRKYVHVMYFIHPDCSLYLRGTQDVSAC